MLYVLLAHLAADLSNACFLGGGAKDHPILACSAHLTLPPSSSFLPYANVHMLIINHLPGAAKDTIAQSDKGPGAWSDSVGNAFLAPYELNNDKSTFTANGTKAPIHQALAGMEGLKVYPWEGAVDPNTAGNISRCGVVCGGGVERGLRFVLTEACDAEERRMCMLVDVEESTLNTSAGNRVGLRSLTTPPSPVHNCAVTPHTPAQALPYHPGFTVQPC